MGCCWEVDVVTYEPLTQKEQEALQELLDDLCESIEHNGDDNYTGNFHAGYGFTLSEWRKREDLQKWFRIISGKEISFYLRCLDTEPDESLDLSDETTTIDDYVDEWTEEW